MEVFDDTYFMRQAYIEAQKAYDLGEVPIGAVIVSQKKIIARGHNLTERLNDVTAHAEMQSITAAANYLGGKYLRDCALYVTLEPCTMCAGALYWSQISKVIYATEDDKRGFQSRGIELHPKTKVGYGLLQDPCKELIQRFFSKKR